MTQNPHLTRALAGLHRDNTTEELRAVYEQGATTTQLAAATGRSGGWVTRRLRHADTRIRPRGRRVQPSATPVVGQRPLPPDGLFELCSIPGLDTALCFPLLCEMHIGDSSPPCHPLRFFQNTMARLWEQAQDVDITLVLIENAHARLCTAGTPSALTASTR